MKKKLNKLLSLSALFLIVACTQVPGIFIGKSISEYTDGIGINKPIGLCLDNSGNLFVADSMNNLIRKVTPKGKVLTFAGVQGDNTVLGYPFDCDFDSKGNLYVSSDGYTSNIGYTSKIYKITSDGKISIFAGGGEIRFSQEESLATKINLLWSSGLAIDSKDNIYILFGNYMPSAVAKITQDGKATIISLDTTEGEIEYFITIDKEKDNFYFVDSSYPRLDILMKKSLTNKELKILPANYNNIFSIPFWETFGKKLESDSTHRSFKSITLDKEGNIYLVNMIRPYGILKILKDETTVEVISELSDKDMIDSLTDLAVDNERGILYFSSHNKNKIYKILLK